MGRIGPVDPDFPVGAEAAAKEGAGRMLQPRDLIACEIVTVELLSCLVNGRQQHGLAIWRPVIGLDFARIVLEAEIEALTRLRIPEQWSLEPAAIGRSQHPVITRARR